MQTVTFTENYDHKLNERQHVAYLAGVTYPDVHEDVVKAAGDRCKPATKAEAKAAAEEPPAG